MAGNVTQMDGKVEKECEKRGYEGSYEPGQEDMPQGPPVDGIYTFNDPHP